MCSLKNVATFAREIKSMIAIAQEAFNKKVLFTSRLDEYLRKKPIKCCIWSIALCGAETWTRRELDRKNLDNF